MLVTTGEIHDLTDLGFCNFVAEHTDNGQAALVHGQHDLERLSVIHPKEPFKNVDHKFHRRVVVIQQHHLIHRRPLGLCTRLKGDRRVAVIPEFV